MLCACIRRALMLTWRNYHQLYPLMVILLRKYVSAVSNYYFYFYCYVFGIFFILLTTKIKILFLVNQFLASEATEAGSIFDDLQRTLSTQQDELELFAGKLRSVCASKFSFFLPVYSF